DGDRAEATANQLVFFHRDGEPPHRTSGLRTTTTAVRTPAGWRFTEMNIALAWTSERWPNPVEPATRPCQAHPMGLDLAAAAAFMARHARVLDRRRFEFLLGSTSADAVSAAVDAYRNPDGGYGWGIEPDLRAPESQPAGALHALEAFAD